LPEIIQRFSGRPGGQERAFRIEFTGPAFPIRGGIGLTGDAN